MVDPEKKILYFTTISKDTEDSVAGNPQGSKYTLYSVDLATGENVHDPYVIQVRPLQNHEPDDDVAIVQQRGAEYMVADTLKSYRQADPKKGGALLNEG